MKRHPSYEDVMKSPRIHDWLDFEGISFPPDIMEKYGSPDCGACTAINIIKNIAENLDEPLDKPF